MPAYPRPDATAVGGRLRPLLPLLLVALLGTLASCGGTDRLADRSRRPPAHRAHPQTVPADKAPLFPGLRKRSKRRHVAAAPGTRRPFTRASAGGAVLRKRDRRHAGSGRAYAKTEPGASVRITAPTAVDESALDAPAPSRTTTRHERRLRADIEEAAASYTGVPYKYGGTTTEGFDCSGFTQYVLRDFGIALKRVSISQAKQGRAVAPDRAEPGDLVYFANAEGRVNHVGIVVSNDARGLVMIHASSSRGIRRDNVTHSRYWGPRLAGARCVVECRAPSARAVKGGRGVASN